MALLTHTIPNLMNGVSQQPITIRLSNQGEEQINGTCRVSDGLSKRLAVEMQLADKYVDPLEMWDLTIVDHRVKMHMVRGKSSSGVTKTVQLIVDGTSGVLAYRYMEYPFSSGVIGKYTYLNNSNKAGLSFLTDGDTTYILNKDVTVMKDVILGDSPDTAMRRQGSMGWVKTGYFGTTYTLKVNVVDSTTNALVSGTYVFTYTTNPSSTTTNLSELESTNIANANSGTLGLGKKLADYVANPANTYMNTNFDVVRDDNWFQLKFKSGSSEALTRRVEMTCTASTSETSIYACNSTIRDAITLPKTGPTGYVTAIDGNPTDTGDQYYLKYSPEASGWVECAKLQLDVDTFVTDSLPLKVTGLIEGGIFVENIRINPRTVGDEETCPDPSFVDKTIHDMFIFNNRLGFLSGNNVIMSRIDEFETFYRTSAASSLSADRVDLKASIPSAKYTELNYAVPFETAIMLFGDAAQYVLNTTTGFDVTKTSLQTSTEYESSKLCAPINLGASVYFPVTRGAYSGIFDLSRKDGIGLTAEEPTNHVPTYILGNVTEMTYSPVENILFVRTTEDKRTIYVQNRFIRQTVLEQNAWHKWTLPNDIIYINVLGSKLYISMVAEDTHTILRASIDIATNRIVPNDTLLIPFKPHLDMLQLVPMGTVLTVDDLGGDFYIAPEHEANLIGVNLSGGQVQGLDEINAALEEEDMYIGVPFTFSYTFSQQVPAQEGDGQKMVYQYGRLTLRSMKISFVNTGEFDVIVSPTGRDSYTTHFTGSILGLASSILGKINIASGVFKFPVNSRSNSVQIKIESSYPYPCTFNTCEWQGMFTNNSGRM